MSASAAQAPEETFWIWLAGFWEGDGGLGYNTDKTCLYLSLGQAGVRGERIINEVARVTGIGKVRFNPRRRPSYQDQWEWRVFKFRDIEAFFARLVPYLRFRKEEVLAFLDEIHRRQKGREWTAGELAILQKHYLSSDRKIAGLLGSRDWRTVRWKREQLGLLKSPGPKPLKSLLRSRLNSQPTGSF